MKIESEILKEIKEKSEEPVYDEVKDMVYTHTSLCESMRLYPPVPLDSKGGSERRRIARGNRGEEGDESNVLSIHYGEVGDICCGDQTGLSSTPRGGCRADAGGGEFQVMEVCGEGLVHVLSVPSGS